MTAIVAHRTLRSIFEEPSHRRLQQRCIRRTRNGSGPNTPRVLMLATNPQRLPPMRRNVCVVLARISVFELRDSTLGITLTKANPTEAVENGRAIRRRDQRLVNQPFGTSEIHAVVGERVSECIH